MECVLLSEKTGTISHSHMCSMGKAITGCGGGHILCSPHTCEVGVLGEAVGVIAGYFKFKLRFMKECCVQAIATGSVCLTLSPLNNFTGSF